MRLVVNDRANGFVKCFLLRVHYLLIAFALLFSTPVLSKQEISSSFLVSASIPIFGFVYSATIEDYEGMKELAYSAMFTAQVTALLKNGVKRTRPNGDNDLSFPSGHASGSFAGASYFHHRYGLSWGLPMYAIASVISIQRVNVRAHYWTDVIAGAALGFLSGYLFTVRCPNVWIAPSFDADRKLYGLQFKMDL